MERQELKTLLQQHYNRERWLLMLRDLLPGTEIFAEPRAIHVADFKAQTIEQLGIVRLADEKQLAILEVSVGPNVNLLRNRVGLRSVVASFIDQQATHGVLAIFRSDLPDFRFTFAARETDWDDNTKDFVRRETAPRRYTYLLGPNESCSTAAERFAILTQKREKAALKDVTDAFSVEQLNKDFFADYCKVFDRVRRDIAEHHPHWTAQTLEQQTQTLLNRLLFMYFIQRKGWLNRERDFLVSNFREHHAKEPESTSYLTQFLWPVFVKLSSQGVQADVAGFDLPFLNGGLFSDEYASEYLDADAKQHKELRISNRTFQHIFDDLLEIYNFTIREDSPRDQEVAIDPEMLGKIFESLVLQLEKTSGGDSLRHDTGSHYTPRPIVHYLCIEGLRGWLEQFPPAPERAEDWPQRLEKLLALDASDGLDEQDRAVLDECLTPEEAEALQNQLDKLRACDPAVGSGAFPVGLLHELVNLIRLCETRARGKDPVAHDGNWVYGTKSRIIRRMIYGVDIQGRAVEICKLRLWLSLMVDYDLDVDVDACTPTAFRRALRNITPLPNLDYKIRRADSLIDRVCGHPVQAKAALTTGVKSAEPLNKLSSAKLAFYSAHTAADKRRHHFAILAATAELAITMFGQAKLELKNPLVPDEDDRVRIRELEEASRDMVQVQEQIRAARKLPAAEQDEELLRIATLLDNPKKPTFVWQIDFAEVFHRTTRAATANPTELTDSAPECATLTGFDLVLGNPPYVRMELFKDIKPELRVRYANVHSERADLYCYFYARALQLLGPTGVLSFITSNKFFRAGYGEPLRKLLKESTELRSIIDFGDLPIFEATAYPCIVVAQNRTPTLGHMTRTLNVRSEAELNRFFLIPTTTVLQNDFGWQFGSNATVGLLAKMRAAGMVLDKYVDGRIYRGVVTGLNEAFIIDDAKRVAIVAESPVAKSVIKPVFAGKDVRRWHVDNHNKWLIYTYQGISTKGLDAIIEHLRQFKKPLEKRATEQEWYELQQPQRKYVAAFEGAKIVWGNLGTRPNFAFYNGPLYANAPANLIPSDDFYLLAILNSTASMFFLREISIQRRGGFIEFKPMYVSALPIPTVPDAERAKLVALVENILAAKRADAAADVRALEQEIDERVYRLYGLTDDEQKLVAESTRP